MKRIFLFSVITLLFLSPVTANDFSDRKSLVVDVSISNDFKIIESSRGSMIEVVLANRINKCNAIKPRFSIQKGEFEKFERRYLPAKDFGIIIISTSNGLMVHNDAKANGLGGKLIAYIY